ncbi:hypothetical protein GF337_02150 [candidate division KSB1 bacterium]|nr:hypothetical protein [candidate division KSB1 bacterium]
MKKFVMICLLLFSITAYAENYLINGGQETRIDYEMVQQIEPNPAINKLYLTFVKPTSYQSPTYNQRITNLNFNFIPKPNNQEEYTDKRGNQVIKVVWSEPRTTIKTIISLTAMNRTVLNELSTRSTFPLTNLSPDAKQYLTSTEQVPASDPQIVAKAKELTAGAKTEFDAVQRILAWVIDHMHYVLTPQDYGAMYSFRSGKGNCQNYSHLSSALMRAVGIPSRVVNGVTLKKPYNVTMGNRILTLKMAEGRHSWIEVYFEDLGWVPFDPQQTALFVSNRFIRIEAGLDNNETTQDGLIRWTQSEGALATPKFEEVIEASYPQDQVALNARKQKYGPRKMLLVPTVKATFTRLEVAPEPEPESIDQDKLQKLTYSNPYLFGNLEFPEDVDFLSSRGPAEKEGAATYEMKKNFLVETAEYVTSGAQYAQVFVLQKPLKLGKIGLALHKFGGNGQLWVEIMKDENGMPGDIISTSDFIPLDQIPFKSGYFWVDFDFKRDWPVLSPGRYWIAMGFTGSPIINWFYSYGKPVGPEDGTRYKTVLDTKWSRSLSYEFNYRVIGLTTP